MRWFWIDRFLEFESGRRAVTVKNVTMAEEHLHGYFPGWPVMPPALVIEGLAQTGGLLVGQVFDYRERVVLAKVGKAKFYGDARPGDTLRYTAQLERMDEDGGMVAGTSHIGDELHAEIDLFFAHLDGHYEERDQFHPAEFFMLLQGLGLFDIGRTPEGDPIQVPPQMLAAAKSAGLLGEES